MGATAELIKAGEDVKQWPNHSRHEVALVASLSDLQRLVEWVKKAPHANYCQPELECICGLSEIQSLLGE